MCPEFWVHIRAGRLFFIVKKRKYVRFYCSHTWLMCYNRWEYDIVIKKGLNITNNNGNGDVYEHL